MHMFEYLNTNLRLKKLNLKNRIVKAPYSSNSADDRGYVTDRAIFHYEAVAKGGVGLFITESTAIDPLGVSGSPRMAIWDNSYIPGLKKLADKVHNYECPIIMQLHHAGPSHSTGLYGGQTSVHKVGEAHPVCSSTLTHEEIPAHRDNLPRGLTISEIGEMVEKYVRAAQRAKEASYDGIELHFAYGYLMNTFFSRAWNKREDKYGGSLENRTRFALQIIKEIKKKLNSDFVIGARMNAIEYNTPLGLQFDETQEIAKKLEKAGLDYLHVSAYGYGVFEWVIYPEQVLYPEATELTGDWGEKVKRGNPLIEGAEKIKKVVGIPVIAVGGMTFEGADKTIKAGKADLVAFGRQIIADPEFPKKIKEGRIDDIRECTHCMTCLDAFMKSEHEKCRVNALFGNEKELEIKPSLQKKQVLVIGGGPGGMEAARVAAMRGHQVTLYESNKRLGGLIPLASMIKGMEIENNLGFVQYLQTQIKKLGVKIKLGKKVTKSVIQKINPDVVILAAGSRLYDPKIPGIERKNVLTSSQLHKRVKLPMNLFGPKLLGELSKWYLPIGKKVVIAGGSIYGCEIAEFLIKRGRKVDIAETSDQIGEGLLDIHKARLLDWMKEKGMEMISGVKYHEITEDGLVIKTKEGKTRLLEGDTVLIVTPPESNRDLQKTLENMCQEIHYVGDCKNPGLIVDAVKDGHRIACSI